MAVNQNVNTPVYAWYAPFITGLGLTYVNTTSIAVAEGSATNSNLQNVITVPTLTTVSTTFIGAGGLDTGAVAASTAYAVYAIGSSANLPNDIVDDETTVVSAFPGTAILSTSYTQPVLPPQYDMFRYVGSVFTNSSSEIVQFVQTGNTMRYNNAINVLSGGVSTTYANVNLSNSVPKPGLEVLALLELTPDTDASLALLAPYGSTSSTGYALVKGQVAAVVAEAFVTVPCASNAGAPYIVYSTTSASDSVNISISGYVDII